MSEEHEFESSPDTGEIIGDVLYLQNNYPNSIDSKPDVNCLSQGPPSGFTNNLLDLLANTKVVITEQPATNKLRFR